MMSETSSIDDLSALQALLDATDALLLDFDGPICSVFAGYPAPMIADQLRDILAEGGYKRLPREIEKTEDPFEVFKYSATLGESEAHLVESSLRAHEVEAVISASSTPGAFDLITSWSNADRKLAVVSNNSTEAVEVYLNRKSLLLYFHAVSGRRSSDPNLLKPSRFLLDLTLDIIDSTASRCLLVGDSVSDIIAARAAGIRSIGYANRPEKVELLRTAGASAITQDIRLIAQALS